MALINPEYRNATITDSYLNWMTGKDNRQHGGIVIEVEFEDKTRRQKLYNLTEGAAPYTTKALRDIGWMGKTYKDFLKPQLVGTAVNVTLADAVDRDGNVRVDNAGNPFREIAFINPPRGYRRATESEGEALAHHFDKYLQPEGPGSMGPDGSEDSDLPF